MDGWEYGVLDEPKTVDGKELYPVIVKVDGKQVGIAGWGSWRWAQRIALGLATVESQERMQGADNLRNVWREGKY